MRTLIRNDDLKTLFVGAAFAVGLGLVGGAAMQPRLHFGEGPEGPQMLTGESGRRATEDPYSPYAVYAAYPQTLPDYVIGTDWTQPPPVDAAPAPDEAVVYEAPSAPDHARDVADREPMPAQDEDELEDLAAATPG